MPVELKVIPVKAMNVGDKPFIIRNIYPTQDACNFADNILTNINTLLNHSNQYTSSSTTCDDANNTNNTSNNNNDIIIVTTSRQANSFFRNSTNLKISHDVIAPLGGEGGVLLFLSCFNTCIHTILPLSPSERLISYISPMYRILFTTYTYLHIHHYTILIYTPIYRCR